jgi:hypothetical protein
MDKEGVVERLRAQIEAAGSARKMGKQHGISAQYLSDVLTGKREPAGKILAALGVERVVSYRVAKREKA